MYVRVRVGEETYAMPIEHVLEVSELGAVAPVPGAPAAALGVRNLRGQVLPVFDLADVLGVERETPPSRLVVAEDGAERAGFAVDEVADVALLDETTQESDSPLLVGSTLDDGTLVGIVDVPQLFRALASEEA